jgi:hypothetical protein
MNVLGKYVSCFKVQHTALDTLKRLAPSPRSSAVKLYLWLCYRGIFVQEDVATIKNRIGLFEGAIVNSRKQLTRAGLIGSDFNRGRGAIHEHSILNVKTGQPVNWADRPSYFQVPHSVMLKDHYVELGGTALLVYLVVLAMVNKTGRPSQTLTAETLAKRACVSMPTLDRALDELTGNASPLIRMAARELELLHPETGQTLPEVDAEGENLVFREARTGKRIGMDELLSPRTFKRYYSQELRDIDPTVAQQDVHCPFHADSTPSMSINTETGEWFCHACDVGGGMVHFEMRLLEIEDKRHAWQSIGKKLDVTLRGKKLGQPTSEHVWRDADEETLFVIRRYADGSARPYHPVAGRRKMKLGMGSAKGKRTLYNLPEVLAADTVIFVEGETKADPLTLLGLQDSSGKDVAITTSGGANSWRSDLVELLRGKRVVLLPDADEVGSRYAEKIQASLDHAGIQHKIVYLEGYKDVRRFLEQNPPQTLIKTLGVDWLQLPNLQLPQLVGSIQDI